jgi:hypothetical protein
MAKKKPDFAQNNKLDGFNHRSKHFWTLEEAEKWLKEQGGGTVKKRNAGVFYINGGDPTRTWADVLEVTDAGNVKHLNPQPEYIWA